MEFVLSLLQCECSSVHAVLRFVSNDAFTTGLLQAALNLVIQVQSHGPMSDEHVGLRNPLGEQLCICNRGGGKN